MYVSECECMCVCMCVCGLRCIAGMPLGMRRDQCCVAVQGVNGSSVSFSLTGLRLNPIRMERSHTCSQSASEALDICLRPSDGHTSGGSDELRPIHVYLEGRERGEWSEEDKPGNGDMSVR